MDSTTTILESAAVLFKRYGVKSVTMDDVSRELGISKKTLYQHVENKADLIEKTMRVFIEQEKSMIRDIKKMSQDAVHELVMLTRMITQTLCEVPPNLTYDLQKYYRKCWDIMEDYNRTYIYSVIKDNIERGIKQGAYRQDVHPDIIAKIYAGKISIVVDEDLFPLRNYNKENLFRQYMSYHLHGIASSKGLKLLAKHTKDLL